MSRFKIVAVAAIVAVVMDVVCTCICLSAGFPLGPLLYYPAYALLYPAFRVYWLIPIRYLTVEERYVTLWLFPFIEFFIVALFVLEVRRRRLATHSKDKTY